VRRRFLGCDQCPPRRIHRFSLFHAQLQHKCRPPKNVQRTLERRDGPESDWFEDMFCFVCCFLAFQIEVVTLSASRICQRDHFGVIQKFQNSINNIVIHA